jgi:hypothetical protein
MVIEDEFKSDIDSSVLNPGDLYYTGVEMIIWDGSKWHKFDDGFSSDEISPIIIDGRKAKVKETNNSSISFEIIDDLEEENIQKENIRKNLNSFQNINQIEKLI